MIDNVILAPHDPMPEGPDRQVVVLRRFEEDGPSRPSVQIVLTGKPPEITHPRKPDGSPMSLDEAVAAARRVAEEEGLSTIYVLDRLQGERERDIMQHGGDHSVHMDRLSDTDGDGTGSDMRDVIHPAERG